MPQMALNPHSDYATEGLDLFQVIIVMGELTIVPIVTA